MILIGIDIGKLSHAFSIVSKETGDVLLGPTEFSNDKDGFAFFHDECAFYEKEDLLIGMEDTGHYHFALLKDLLDRRFSVALVNPVATDLTRKLQGGVSKNDELDSLTICDVISSSSRKKPYRITKVDRFDLYEQRQLTRHHHNLKEELNVHANRLQKCVDIVFPEHNALFKSKYGRVYMEILGRFASAETIAGTDIGTLRKCFEVSGGGRRVSLTAERLKAAAKDSVGVASVAEEIQIRHLVRRIEPIKEQIAEIDKKIEEFSVRTDSPILSIPGISHFSGTSILAELGDIRNYQNAAKVIKFAGVAPYERQSGQYRAEHAAISKKGSKYLRKTLCQVILPVIQNNEVFQEYYRLKRSRGKGRRCAQGHRVRKLPRVVYHLLTTQQRFDPLLLR